MAGSFLVSNLYSSAVTLLMLCAHVPRWGVRWGARRPASPAPTDARPNSCPSGQVACYLDRGNLARRQGRSRLPSDEQAPIAAELGYSDLDQMCREHDPFHVALCDLLGLPVSYAMREAAGEQLTPDEHWAAVPEETAVLAALKFRQHCRWVLAQAKAHDR